MLIFCVYISPALFSSFFLMPYYDGILIIKTMLVYGFHITNGLCGWTHTDSIG